MNHEQSSSSLMTTEMNGSSNRGYCMVIKSLVTWTDLFNGYSKGASACQERRQDSFYMFMPSAHPEEHIDQCAVCI